MQCIHTTFHAIKFSNLVNNCRNMNMQRLQHSVQNFQHMHHAFVPPFHAIFIPRKRSLPSSCILLFPLTYCDGWILFLVSFFGFLSLPPFGAPWLDLHSSLFFFETLSLSTREWHTKAYLFAWLHLMGYPCLPHGPKDS